MDALELLLARLGLIFAGLFLTMAITISGARPINVAFVLIVVTVIVYRNRRLPALYAA